MRLSTIESGSRSSSPVGGVAVAAAAFAFGAACLRLPEWQQSALLSGYVRVLALGRKWRDHRSGRARRGIQVEDGDAADGVDDVDAVEEIGAPCLCL